MAGFISRTSKRRRSSWSFGKDDVIFRIPASMKSALSALHLDCLQPDHIQSRKNTQSVLSTLTAAALPCMAPLRSRLHSDTCSIKVDGADEREQTSTLQRSSTFLANPARSLSAPRDFDSHLLGVHGPIRTVRSSASLFPLG
ncbi:unnamed protein product [Dicrocoelium dendriticum]|nr:unnamed protein product [Dicrocoelium dendriticum]